MLRLLAMKHHYEITTFSNDNNQIKLFLFQLQLSLSVYRCVHITVSTKQISKLELSIYKRQTANITSAKVDQAWSFISFSRCLWIDLERFVLQETFCSWLWPSFAEGSSLHLGLSLHRLSLPRLRQGVFVTYNSPWAPIHTHTQDALRQHPDCLRASHWLKRPLSKDFFRIHKTEYHASHIGALTKNVTNVKWQVCI